MNPARIQPRGQYALTRVLSKLTGHPRRKVPEDIHLLPGTSGELHPWEANASSLWFSICVIGLISSHIQSLWPIPILSVPLSLLLAILAYFILLNLSVVCMAPVAGICSRLTRSAALPEYKISGALILILTSVFAVITLLANWPGVFFAWLILIPILANAVFALVPPGNRKQK